MRQIIKVTPVDSVVKDKERQVMASVLSFQNRLEAIKSELIQSENALIAKKEEHSGVMAQATRVLEIKGQTQKELDALKEEIRIKKSELNETVECVFSNNDSVRALREEGKLTQDYWTKRIKQLSDEFDQKNSSHIETMKRLDAEKRTADFQVSDAQSKIERLNSQRINIESSLADTSMMFDQASKAHQNALAKYDEAQKALDAKRAEVVIETAKHEEIKSALSNKKQELDQVHADIESKKAEIDDLQRQKIVANEKDRRLARKETILKQTFKSIGLSLSGPFLQSEETDVDKTEFESLQLQCGPDEEVRTQVSTTDPGNPKYYIAKK